MPVKEIESYDEFRKIIDSDQVSVIDFWADWCQPCKMMTPVFNKFAELDEFKGVHFYSCDTEEQERVMMECNIKAMPSFMVFQSGNKIGEVTGSYPQKLQELLKNATEKSKSTAPVTAPETAASASDQKSEVKPEETQISETPAPVPAPANGATETITSYDHFKEIIESGKVVVVDFWADWCQPCKMMTPVFKKFAILDEFKDVGFYTCDVEEQEQVMIECNVKSMPSFMAFQSGEKIGEAIGTYPQKLQDLLKTAAQLASTGATAATPAEKKLDTTPAIATAADTPAL